VDFFEGANLLGIDPTELTATQEVEADAYGVVG
jgi:hypothetical protein